MSERFQRPVVGALDSLELKRVEDDLLLIR
jgi:hypothetical protein